jgi:branched-subunit amino acid aminotransferase/4-amino-4-deoxychorismate lyase
MSSGSTVTVRRLEHSARILQLRLPGSVPEVANTIVELLRRNEMRGDVYIRPIERTLTDAGRGHQRHGDLLHADGPISVG